MPLKHRELQEGKAVFFITTSRFRRQRFPGYPESLEIIQEILFRTAKEKGISIMAYAIMPTHLHLIAGTLDGGKGISNFMHSLKGRVRETLSGKEKFWNDRFDDVHLRSSKQFAIKLNYIHYNPVKAQLVDSPEKWRYSSYCDWLEGQSGIGISIEF